MSFSLHCYFPSHHFLHMPHCFILHTRARCLGVCILYNHNFSWFYGLCTNAITDGYSKRIQEIFPKL